MPENEINKGKFSAWSAFFGSILLGIGIGVGTKSAAVGIAVALGVLCCLVSISAYIDDAVDRLKGGK